LICHPLLDEMVMDSWIIIGFDFSPTNVQLNLLRWALPTLWFYLVSGLVSAIARKGYPVHAEQNSDTAIIKDDYNNVILLTCVYKW